MQHLGGKHYSSKQILPFLLRHEPERVIEPFIGGGHILLRGLREGYAGEWIAGDLDADLTAYWTAVVEDGWIPDRYVKPSRELYEALKAKKNPTPTPLRGLLRTGAAYGGNPWSSYALDAPPKAHWKKTKSRWETACNVAEKEAAVITGSPANITIHGGDFADYEQFLTPTSVVYCDPPYAGTTGYSKEGFDHARFWDTVREWSAICPVYISEYSAPDDFISVFERDMLLSAGGGSRVGAKKDRLFTLAGGLGDLPLAP